MFAKRRAAARRPDERRRLDAETLAQLPSLKLRVQRVVDGVLAGLHRSPHRGASVEFAEHKEYSPGDDLRRLDWKALGKFDRHMIRQYEDETELRAYLLLDCSGSMGYGAPGLSKLDLGAILAGALASVLARQRDQAGLLAFSEEVSAYVPPRARANHLGALLAALEGLEAGGETSVESVTTRLLEVARRRSLVVLISDLFDAGDALARLKLLRGRGHQVLVVHLLHSDELTFPFRDVSLFRSLESPEEILADPGGIRRAYRRELEAFLEETESACRDSQLRYQRVSSDTPLDRVLVELLHGGGR